MNTRQAKKSDNSVAGGDEGGVAAAVNIPDLEDLVTKAVEAAVRSSETNYPSCCKIWKVMLLTWKPALKLWSRDKKIPTMNSPTNLKIMTFERPYRPFAKRIYGRVWSPTTVSNTVADRTCDFVVCTWKKTKIAAKLLPPSSTHDSGCRSQKSNQTVMIVETNNYVDCDQCITTHPNHHATCMPAWNLYIISHPPSSVLKPVIVALNQQWMVAVQYLCNVVPRPFWRQWIIVYWLFRVKHFLHWLVLAVRSIWSLPRLTKYSWKRVHQKSSSVPDSVLGIFESAVSGDRLVPV